LRPGKRWALAAGASELGGGALTALGLFSPLGPIGVMAAMAMATKAHRGKPIWVTEGGAELPITYFAIGFALALAGPGYYSLDRAFGIRLPGPVVAAAAAAAAVGVAVGYRLEPEAPAEQEVQPGQPAAQPAEAEQQDARREVAAVEA
jgi:putative oxidoreductase